MQTQIYTIRHGESDTNANKPGTFDDGDPALSDKGHWQIERVGPYAARLSIGIIVCSPTTRTRQTAEIVAEYLSEGVPTVYDRRACEQYWAGLKGMNKADFFDDDMQALAQAEGLAFRGDPDAESVLDVADRVLSLAAEWEDYGEGNVLFVTHGQPSKAAPAAAQGVDRVTYLACKVPNGSIARLDLDDLALRTPLFVP